MSGGGYEPPPRPRSGNPGNADCNKLRFSCVLNGVDPSVLDDASVGDICDVVLRGVPPTQVLQVLTRPNGEMLGAIVDRWSELIHCIGRGTEFVAEVITTSAPVTVDVRPR